MSDVVFFPCFLRSLSFSKVAESDSQVWNFSPRIPGNQDTNFSQAAGTSCYRQVNKITALIGRDSVPMYSIPIKNA